MIKGIHHITAVASNAKETLDFYSNILGLRLVKKTVNQDDVETYHLFFGDKKGNPGMDLTFFVFLPTHQGVNGNGLVTKIAFAVPENSLDFWINRFENNGVNHTKPIEKNGLKRVCFFDLDNLALEFVETKDNDKDLVWHTSDVSKENAIKSFYSATLSVTSKITIDHIILNIFGYKHTESVKNIHLYKLEDSNRANVLEIIEEPSSITGVSGAGTVHHIAFRAKDLKELLYYREQVLKLGLFPTDVIDRFYFKSVYFRTPANILFEIATDGPGFTVDEDIDKLGQKLALPPFLENQRIDIESNLVNI